MTTDLKPQLEKLQQDRDQFFSIMSHDLRGPVASLPEYIKMIIAEFEDDPAEALHMLNIAYRTSLQSSNLLHSLLQWANVQRGKMSFEPQAVQLSTVCAHIIKEQAECIDKKQLRVQNNINDNYVIEGDLNMLKIIFYQIIANAIHFNIERGAITIDARQENNAITTTITDTGIGIKHQGLGKLFAIDDHYSSRGTGETGSGLGLAICQVILQKHNSSITIKSELNQGTAVSFSLKKYPF